MGQKPEFFLTSRTLGKVFFWFERGGVGDRHECGKIKRWSNLDLAKNNYLKFVTFVTRVMPPKKAKNTDSGFSVSISTTRFQHSRISRSFSDGRSVADAVRSVLDGSLSPYDFPPIEVIPLSDDPTSFCSLNNRRLFVLKEAIAAGKLDATQGTFPARLRQAKSAKESARYSTTRCSLKATMMREQKVGVAEGAAEPAVEDSGSSSD